MFKVQFRQIYVRRFVIAYNAMVKKIQRFETKERKNIRMNLDKGGIVERLVDFSLPFYSLS